MHQRVLVERSAAARSQMAAACLRIGDALGIEIPNLDITERDPQVQILSRDEAVAAFLDRVADGLTTAQKPAAPANEGEAMDAAFLNSMALPTKRKGK